MGIPGQVTAATPKNLLHLVESLPPNALWLANGNAQIVEKMVRLVREVGREIAVPSETRRC